MELFARLVEIDLSCRAWGQAMSSGDGITSVKFESEEFANGDDLAAATAFTTDAYVSAPKVA